MARNQKGHIIWAENARGLAIFLVVFGHSSIPENVKAAVYSFHMHLFFFLSGLLFSSRSSFLITVRKKANTLLLPYFFYSLLGYFVWIFRVKIVHSSSVRVDLLKPFLDIFTMGTFWFLPVLFLVIVLFYIFHNYINMYTYIPFMLLMVFFHSITTEYYLTPYIGVFVHSLNAIVFFAFGYLYRKHVVTLDWRIGISCALVFVVIFLFGNSLYGLQTIGKVTNYLYAYVLAFTAILAVVSFSCLIQKNISLSFLGANSLLIYLLHEYPGALYMRCFKTIGLDTTVMPHAAFGFLQTGANFLILVLPILFINKYLSWSLGRFSRQNGQRS